MAKQHPSGGKSIAKRQVFNAKASFHGPFLCKVLDVRRVRVTASSRSPRCVLEAKPRRDLPGQINPPKLLPGYGPVINKVRKGAGYPSKARGCNACFPFQMQRETSSAPGPRIVNFSLAAC